MNVRVCILPFATMKESPQIYFAQSRSIAYHPNIVQHVYQLEHTCERHMYLIQDMAVRDTSIVFSLSPHLSFLSFVHT